MVQIIYWINLGFQIYMLMLLVRVFSSWVPQFSQTKFMRFVAYYTDPYLNLFRRFVPPLGMFDFSPIVAFLCLSFIQNLVIRFIVFLR